MVGEEHHHREGELKVQDTLRRVEAVDLSKGEEEVLWSHEASQT